MKESGGKTDPGKQGANNVDISESLETRDESGVNATKTHSKHA